MATRTTRILSVQPVAERGGSDHALLRLARSLPRPEFDFHIASPGPSPLARELADAGVTVHEVPMRRLSTTHGAAQWSAYALGWPIAVARLVRLIRRLHVDVVHSNSLHSLYGWAAAALTRRPHVWHGREIVVQSRAALALERFLCAHFATRVIAVSEAVADQLDRRNVVVAYENVDPIRFRPDNAGRFRTDADLDDDSPLVGTIARLDPQKGLDDLLDAFAVVRDARPTAQLVLVTAPVTGREAYAAALRARASRSDGVTLLAPRDDIADLIADLDVLAVASVEPESYGLVVVEALASGVPVVATDHGGPREILAKAPSGGRLVPPRRPPALAAALLDALPEATSAAARSARAPLLLLPAPPFAALFREAAAGGRRRRGDAGPR